VIGSSVRFGEQLEVCEMTAGALAMHWPGRIAAAAGCSARVSSVASAGDLESALTGLAELRTRLPDIDGVALAREARTNLSTAALERRP
jgi:hypothetical protein